jgi:UDP-N-acetylmuramate dehydrogenase
MLAIQEKIPLARYTTFQVGGTADYFVEPETEEEILEALRWARARSLPLFILGGGSNLLVSDTGFRGLVIHISVGGIETAERSGRLVYSVGAGANWDSFVQRAITDGCAGVECLSGIPGSVGGTPVQNVGAYGQDVSETITRVCAVDVATLQHVEFEREACGFQYRSSRFHPDDPRAEAGRYVLTRVDYSLRPGGPPKISYPDLKQYFIKHTQSAAIPTLAQTREAILAIRSAKGMVLDEADPNSRGAGSFFKNPIISLSEFEQIAAVSAGPVPHFDAGPDHVKLSAAWLIERSGIGKGFSLGAAAISRKHTLALVNRGGAKASDIIRLKNFVQHRVHRRFGIQLRPEPVMLGFDE